MLIVGIAAILLASSNVLTSQPSCVSIEDGDDKTGVIASCTFMDLQDIPRNLPPDSVLGLDLSDNQLKVLHNESFSLYVNLRTLTISYNEIQHVQREAFSGLQQLLEVDLSYNELEYVDPEIFSGNPKLERVSLAGNPLVFFPDDSPVLISSSLISLDLSSCYLTSVNSVTFSRLPKLIDLDLSSNHMRVISRESLDVLDNLRVVELRNNRWECSCEVKEVMQWASSLREHGSLQRPIKCFEEGQYKTFWSYAKGDESCTLIGVPVHRGHMVEGVANDNTVWYKVPIRIHSKSSFVLAFMILPCVLSICVLVTLVVIKCMDRRRAKDKQPLYQHLQE